MTLNNMSLIDGTGYVSSDGTSWVLVSAENPLPVAGSFTGSSASVGVIGSTAPTSADQIGIPVGGNLVAVSAANPLPITGSISATNPSVGVTGTTAPTSATEVGIISGGNLVGVSSSNPLPITGTISATNPSVGTTGTTAPTSASEIGLVYNTTAPSPANGQMVAAQSDSQGDMKTYLAALLAGEDLTVGTIAGVLGMQRVSTSIPVPSSTYSPSVDIQNATVTHTSKSTAGNLIGIFTQNTTATAVYLQVWNGATAGTGTLVLFGLLPAGTATSPGTLSFDSSDLTSNGQYCSTAITWGFSSTAITYTAVGSGTGLTTMARYF